MALTTKRIIALPSQTDPQEGDYLAIDNAQGGTHKIPVGRIGVEVDDTLTESGKAADAKATGDAIDALRTQLEVTGTASGAIATFSDGSDAPMKSCIVTIEPQQSGSGTPSPDNVRPISGWESVSVGVSGKNLFDISGWINTFAEGQQVSFENDTMTVGATAGNLYGKPFRFSKTNTTITLSIASADVGSSVAPRFELLNESGSVVGSLTLSAGGGTITRDAVAVRMNWSSNSGFSVTKPQIELGSTATDYEPYTGTTTTVNLGRTVYGGTLDVVSGVLTVDRAIVTFDGSSDESYVIGAYGMAFRTYLPNDFKPTTNNRELAGLVSNQMTEVTQASTWGTVGTCALIANTNQLYFKLADELTDISELRTYLANNPMQIVYPLATPQTYTLTPTQINTLLGENNVWADAGDVSVVYVRDLNIAINNLIGE